MLHVSGVAHIGGLEEQELDLAPGDRPMFDAARDHRKFARPQLDLSVPEINPQPAFQDQEHLVGVFVVMPHEFAEDLDDLDLLPVEFGDDLGTPMF